MKYKIPAYKCDVMTPHPHPHPSTDWCYLCFVAPSLCPPAPPAARRWPGRTPNCTVGPSAGIWSGPNFPPGWFQSPSATRSAPQGRAWLRWRSDPRPHLADQRQGRNEDLTYQRENDPHKWEIKHSLPLFPTWNAFRPLLHICCYDFITISLSSPLSWLSWNCLDTSLCHWHIPAANINSGNYAGSHFIFKGPRDGSLMSL